MFSATGPKITGSLTNIQSRTTPIEAKPIIDQNQGNEKTDDSDKSDEEKKNKSYSQFTKYCMAFCGVSMGAMGSYLVYEMAKPKYDEEGNMIEDEFTNLPYPEQLFKRMLSELNYYKKVSSSKFIFGNVFGNFNFCVI